MTIIEAKDRAAQEYGYANFHVALNRVENTLPIMERAMELYAETKVKNVSSNSCVSGNAGLPNSINESPEVALSLAKKLGFDSAIITCEKCGQPHKIYRDNDR